jgi:hypothetical protein
VGNGQGGSNASDAFWRTFVCKEFELARFIGGLGVNDESALVDSGI